MASISRFSDPFVYQTLMTIQAYCNARRWYAPRLKFFISWLSKPHDPHSAFSLVPTSVTACRPNFGAPWLKQLWLDSLSEHVSVKIRNLVSAKATTVVFRSKFWSSIYVKIRIKVACLLTRRTQSTSRWSRVSMETVLLHWTVPRPWLIWELDLDKIIIKAVLICYNLFQ